MCVGFDSKKPIINPSKGEVAGVPKFAQNDPLKKQLMKIEDKNIGLRQNMVWAMQDFAKKNKINNNLVGVEKADKDNMNSDYNDQSKRNNGWWGGQAKTI